MTFASMIFVWAASILFSLMNILSVVFLMFYINNTAKLKNQDIGAGWYIGAFFFPLITAIVFISESKKFPGETTKVCYQCGDRYPENFTMCTRCLIDLPAINKTNKEKQKKSAKHFGAAFWCVTVISLVAIIAAIGTGIYWGIDIAEDILSVNRIGVENEAGDIVYYDKKGNSYENAEDVLLYDENGEVYKYVTKEIEDYDGSFYEDWFFVDSKGKEYQVYDCYVTSEGWFYYDEDYELYMDYSDIEYEEELSEDASFSEIIDDMMSELDDYKYYNDIYLDDEGNVYYYAETASWNEKGEIITEKNDPSLVKTAE